MNNKVKEFAANNYRKKPAEAEAALAEMDR